MAAPVSVARTTTSVSTAATSVAVNTGTPVSGELGLCLGRFAGAPGTITMTGYGTLPDHGDTSDAADDTLVAFRRDCDGTEGATDTLSWTNSVKAAFIYLRISGYDSPASTNTPESIVTTGAGANLIGGTLTPLVGTRDYLWVAMYQCDGETIAVGTPSGYTHLTAANSGTAGAAASNCMVWTADKQALGVSTEGPAATFGNSAPNSGGTYLLVGIYAPAAAAADPTGFAATARVYNPAVARAVQRIR